MRGVRNLFVRKQMQTLRAQPVARFPGDHRRTLCAHHRLRRPQAGIASTSFAVPRNVGLVGVSLVQQVLQLSLNAQNQPVDLLGSNGLALVVGTY